MRTPHVQATTCKPALVVRLPNKWRPLLLCNFVFEMASRPHLQLVGTLFYYSFLLKRSFTYYVACMLMPEVAVTVETSGKIIKKFHDLIKSTIQLA